MGATNGQDLIQPPCLPAGGRSGVAAIFLFARTVFSFFGRFAPSCIRTVEPCWLPGAGTFDRPTPLMPEVLYLSVNLEHSVSRHSATVT
jgi:hypothetical protein